MRILEIGECRYVSRWAPAISDFYIVTKHSSPEKRLTLRNILLLRKRLEAGYYDLVVYHLTAKIEAPWHRNQGTGRMMFDVLTASLFKFHKISWHYFHRALCAVTVPLVVIDTQDVPRITQTESHWLDRCRYWFMRELPPNHLNLFLNMNRRCGDVTNISRQHSIIRNLDKLESFGLGFNPPGIVDFPPIDPQDKIHDIFYAGANHTTTVRQRGYEELRALQSTGLRVFLPTERLSKTDFFRACAQSWLVWSPEGQGWDCYRHYEALMNGSVPLINLPTIEHLHPFQHGEHCLYHRPEPGGLTDAVLDALKNREALLKIAGQGRRHALQHHTYERLVRHVLAKTGHLEQAEPHLVQSSDRPL